MSTLLRHFSSIGFISQGPSTGTTRNGKVILKRQTGMAYSEQCCLEEVSGSKALCALGLAGLLYKCVFFTKPGSKLQRVKIVVSDSPGLVDFAIGLVIFVLN